MSDQGGDDPIYRAGTPQDGVPWEPPVPPPSGPGYMSGPSGTPPQPPRRKRWPWIVGLFVLLCGLPLGGCIALLGLGLNEIDSRNDAIRESVDSYVEATQSGNPTAADAYIDGNVPCAGIDGFASDAFGADVEAGGWDSFEIDRISFTDRSDNSSFSSNAGPEGITIDGREGASAARVIGVGTFDGLPVDLEIILTKPLVSWKICTINAR